MWRPLRDGEPTGRRRSKTEAMRAKTDESPSIKSKMVDVTEAVAAVKRHPIGGLPKMRRACRTDVSDLAVSVNSLTPVSEPLYAVACRSGGLACCPGAFVLIGFGPVRPPAPAAGRTARRSRAVSE